MKRNVFLAFAGTTLLITYLLVLRIDVDSMGEPARFFPESAILYFEQRQGIRAIEAFFDAPLGRRLAGIDFIAAGNQIGLEPHVNAFLQQIPEKLKSLTNDRLATTLLGKRFALALLPPLDEPGAILTEKFFEENTVLVAEPEQPAALLQLLAEGYVQYDETLTLTTAQYGRHRIQRFSRTGRTIALIALDGFLVVALNERQLRRCIDAFDGEIPSLAGNKDYRGLQGNFLQADHFLYSPLDTLRSFVGTLLTSHDIPYREIIAKELSHTKGFTALAYGAWHHPQKMFDRVMVQYDRALVNDLAGLHLDIAPTRSTMFHLTTTEPMLYYWSNVLAFRNYLPVLADDSGEESRFTDFNRQVQKITGQKIEEILPLLGNELSLVVEKGAGGSFFSFPRGLVFLRSSDPLRLRYILEELCIAYDVPLTGRHYGPVEYMYWSLAPEDGLRPLYGFWGDLFFIGNSTVLVKKLVDSWQGGHSLLDHDIVRRHDPGLGEANNSVVYLDTIAILELAERVIDLLGTILGIEDRQTAVKARVVISEIIRPLLEGAKMYRAGVTRSYFSSDTVVVESITKLVKEEKK